MYEKLFEYCILERDPDNDNMVIHYAGPELILVKGKDENKLIEQALFEIGRLQEYTGYMPEIYIRPFC